MRSGQGWEKSSRDQRTQTGVGRRRSTVERDAHLAGVRPLGTEEKRGGHMCCGGGQEGDGVSVIV